VIPHPVRSNSLILPSRGCESQPQVKSSRIGLLGWTAGLALWVGLLTQLAAALLRGKAQAAPGFAPQRAAGLPEVVAGCPVFLQE
jgi:hypothetical protein